MFAGGYLIPAGMIVICSVATLHVDEEYYPDPEKFNPDNFLPERVAARHPYAFLPFSAGPRSCIGQKFAMLEMKTILSYILRHYKLEATRDPPKGLPHIVLRPIGGIHVRIKRR